MNAGFEAATEMPDGPRYDDDCFAWTQYQAEVPRSLATVKSGEFSNLF